VRVTDLGARAVEGGGDLFRWRLHPPEGSARPDRLPRRPAGNLPRMNAEAVEPVAIATRRLDLLPLCVGHAEEMAEVLSAPELHRFTGGVPETGQALRARYERLVAGSPDADVSWCNWVVRLRGTGDLTGTLQATVTAADAGGVAEVSWVVGKDWQRRGIATEAATGLVSWLATRPVRTVIAHIHPDHRASAAVAAAAGLTPTGHLHDGEVRWQLLLGGDRPETGADGKRAPVGRTGSGPADPARRL
jgi:RimJ/RimL family protein N-acetyltransferase